MAETVIDIQALTKSYQSIKAVDQLTLQINRGEIFGLLGPNGAGKSTTILMLLGLSEPDSGTIQVLGMNPTRDPLPVKRRVGYLPDDVGFYEDRSGLENLLLTARLNQVPEDKARQRAAELLELVGLTHAAHKKAGSYSRGMRQRLGLADVLMKSPEIIILDEPTLGIDPTGMEELLSLIKSLSKEQGLTVLLSSHQLHQVQQICDRVGLFVNGKLLAEGNVESLSRTLFADDPIYITAEIDHVSEALLEQVTALPGIQQATLPILDGHPLLGANESSKQLLQVEAETDLTPDIARLIVSSGTSLYSLTKQQYGLDEIYHRYFQGGEADERRGQRKHAKVHEG